MDIIEMLLLIAGGLALFLYAVVSLGNTLQEVAGERMKRYIERFTGNIATSMLTGFTATALLDSSSAVIIIAIVLVNTGLLKLQQSMAIVLGANIGTTVSSQIIALDIAQYSPVLLVIGLMLMFIVKHPSINAAGKIVLYFGILFFGLFTMENAVVPLKQHEAFMDWMQQLAHPIRGIGTGALVTLVIQSSSATVGMAITLAKKGLISNAGGIAVMLGAELGTCSDTLLATIKGTRVALKTALFHLIFNLISIVIGYLLFNPFIDLVVIVSGSHAEIQTQIANAHVLFNLTGALIAAPFIPFIAKLLNQLLPDKTA